MKKITYGEILKKVAMFEALEVVLNDTIVTDDIKELLRKYKALRQNAEDAGLEPENTLIYPENDEEVRSMTSALTSHVQQKEIIYRNCTITRGKGNGRYCIKKGGKVAVNFTPSTPQTVTAFYDRIKAENYIDEQGNILKDIECSASMAVSIISGANKNGRPILASLWD